MGKGTKRKTVWRTFSFENGNCNKNDTSPVNQNNNGQENTPTSNDTNGRPVSNWRYRRFHSNVTEMLTAENETHDDSLQKSKELNVEQMTNTNGYHNNNYGYRHQYHHHYNRPYYKRWPLSDQQYARNGFRKFTNENANSGSENGTHGENDDNINNEEDSNRIQSNHCTRSYRTPFHRHNGGYRKWENRYYHPNSSTGNYYSRGFRRSFYSQSDKQYPTFTKNNDHYYNRHFLPENGINTHDDDKQNDESFENQNGKQDSIKLNEDEYTRISTPRSEVLFKKGYLMRTKKYTESTTPPTTAKSSNNPPTSSNDSGSVSVVSNEETASYYSIQSMSPENSAFVNGNICNDGASISYPNENYNGDVPLIFSSGFYDNNGYFYVNPYVPSHYDQYNRPIGLISYDSATPANDPGSTSPAIATDAKSIDDDHVNDFNKQHSINSEDISTSSLSENVSINNDSVTPQSPLTPPPSPLSPSERLSSDDNTIECAENIDETTTKIDEPSQASALATTDVKTFTETNNNKVERKPIEDMQSQSNKIDETDVIEPSEETVVPDNYSMPYYPPIIFVPPIPFVPGGPMPYQRRNRFHRRNSYHRHNHFRKYNRFCQYNDKYYVPTNWSEAPDETIVNVVKDSSAISDAEPAADLEKTYDIIETPTLEQCDIILKNSKLNSNVSEFVPKTKWNTVILVNQVVPSPICIQPSQLNVNVPEFLPKNYKPLAKFQSSDDINNTTSKCDEIEDNNSNSITNKTFDQSAAESKDNDEKQKLDQITNRTKSDKYSQNDQDQQSITNCAASGSKDCVENYNNNNNKNKLSTVRTLSDLLKTYSDTKTLVTNENSFVDRSKLNKSISDAKSSGIQQNSRMNLKAELGNKHRNKVWYNRNSSADYKNNNDLNINTNRNNNDDKTMKNNNDNNNINNNRMIKSAYPAINGNHQYHVKYTDVIHNNITKSPTAATPTIVLNRNDSKTLLNEGFSYAQMVVPSKTDSIQFGRNATSAKLKPAKNITNIINDKINLKPIKSEKTPSIEMKQSNNGSVEWFTVGAKGKKQALSNDKPNFVDFTMKLLQESTSKEEQVNSVAEELQLDIKNDSDLVMDIMDSLALSGTKTTTNQALNAGQKKKSSAAKTSKKKSTKDKMIKVSKRSRSQTFEIIEPNFENGSKQIAITDDQATKLNQIVTKDEDSKINNDEEFTFNPNVFTAPLNLKADIAPENIANVGSSCTALRLSANKSIRSLMNTFDIYQSDLNVSAENKRLQKAEEMVNRVLESLKKTENSDDECASNETNPTDSSKTIQEIQPNNALASDDDDDDDDDDLNSSHSSASSISFEVNAKPYQNAYSSNHFLGHFFGDKNDKRDQVVHSANLSSSDQKSYTHAEQLNEFNVSNSESTLNITDAKRVHNDEISKSECNIVTVVSPVELISSKIESLFSNNESDHEQNPEAFDDQRSKFPVESKLNENEEHFDTEFRSGSNTKLEFTQKTAHSIDDSPSSREIYESVVEQQKIPSIDLIEKTDESVQNEAKAETKSNHQIPNKPRPWLYIVDTQMLEKQKKMQNTFPITTAVSMWLNQAQKEKTPEPILRLPNDLHGNRFFSTKRTKTFSQTSQSTATSVGTDQYYHLDNYSSDETVSLTSERDEKDKIDLASIVNDDEEDDIMNYWELDLKLTPQTPPAYQSVYGNSINYEKILSNKNELLCNNIIDFDHVEETVATNPQIKATVNKQGPQTKFGPDENYFKPAPEVCCTIM